MSHIFPLEGQRHFHVSSELTELGGRSSENFRLAYAWDGEHFFEIPDDDDGDELFNKWIESHGGEVAATPDQPDNDESTVTAAEPSGVTNEPASSAAADTGVTAEPQPTQQATAAPPAAKPEPVEPDTDTGADLDASEDRGGPTDITTAEPPAQSTPDVVAVVQEPATNEPPTRTSTRTSTRSGDTTNKAGSTTSGTNRKRSAKNSNRRS